MGPRLDVHRLGLEWTWRRPAQDFAHHSDRGGDRGGWPFFPGRLCQCHRDCNRAPFSPRDESAKAAAAFRFYSHDGGDCRSCGLRHSRLAGEKCDRAAARRGRAGRCAARGKIQPGIRGEDLPTIHPADAGRTRHQATAATDHLAGKFDTRAGAGRCGELPVRDGSRRFDQNGFAPGHDRRG